VRQDRVLFAAVLVIAASGLYTSGVLVHWDVTSAYMGALSFTLQNYADSDVRILTEVAHTSIILSAYGLDGMDTSIPFDVPIKTKKTVTIMSPDTISRYRESMLDTSQDYDADSADVWTKSYWQHPWVEIYDGSSEVAEFQNPTRPYVPALVGHSKYVSHDKMGVVERIPPEWALLPTYAPGGRALALDGSADITLADGPDFDGTAPFSVALWIRMSEADSPASLIISKWDESLHRGFLMGERPDDRLWFRMADDASGQIAVNSFHSLADGRWHWVVFTYDGSGSNIGLNIYVDGSNDGFRWHYQSLTGSAANDHPLAIGSSKGAGSSDALLDEVMIYSEELPAEYISEVHGCHRGMAMAAAEDARSGGTRAGIHACAGGAYGDAMLAHLGFEGDLSDSSGRGNGGTARGDVRYT